MEAVKVVILEVRFHVTQSYNLLAQVAFGGSGAVGKFVWSHAREQRFGIGYIRVAFLRDFEVAEAAEDGLCWTRGCPVVC